MQKNELRRYVLLRAVQGEALGVARLECCRGRWSVHIHARNLPEEPLRALMLLGDVQTGAVVDLGLMHRVDNGQRTLNCEGLSLRGRVTAVALAADWPGARLLMCGWVQAQNSCTLWQVQQAVERYLSLPACDSAPAPVHRPENIPKPTVLRLRPRLSS